MVPFWNLDHQMKKRFILEKNNKNQIKEVLRLPLVCWVDDHYFLCIWLAKNPQNVFSLYAKMLIAYLTKYNPASSRNFLLLSVCNRDIFIGNWQIAHKTHVMASYCFIVSFFGALIVRIRYDLRSSVQRLCFYIDINRGDAEYYCRTFSDTSQ